MKTHERRSLRCAVYTRKSSEEGLEQSFNSLDAQREACTAFIQSQRQEGWRALSNQYDDGGFSGGNMERPGLKALLADIDAGKIDVVVVYKVDRLTRSLADFAKIIEVFDAREVSFVSVTQQFNTTSSMGRLTLNVLLSFAQFEREVTGERIRDKIAASKRKGMWMGGNLPLGYDLKDRRLLINPEEAERVREIFRLYLKLGCVKKLKDHLDAQRIRSKVRISKSGNRSGGVSFSRGALYKLLANRTYLGEVPHKGESYPGQHEAIIDRVLWEKVRKRMAESIRGERHGRNAAAPSLLRGLVYEESGTRFTPSHAVKNGRRYRYYVSQLANDDAKSSGIVPTRLPARELENLVLAELRNFFMSASRVTSALSDAAEDLAAVRKLINASQLAVTALNSKSHETVSEFISNFLVRVVVLDDSVQIHLHRAHLRACLLESKQPAQPKLSAHSRNEDCIVLTVPTKVRRSRGEMRLIIPTADGAFETSKPIPSLVKAIARGQDWVRAIVAGEYKDQRAIAKALGVNERYVSNVIGGAFLSPKLVEAIANGQQLSEINLKMLLKNVSLSWKAQNARLGTCLSDLY